MYGKVARVKGVLHKNPWMDMPPISQGLDFSERRSKPMENTAKKHMEKANVFPSGGRNVGRVEPSANERSTCDTPAGRRRKTSMNSPPLKKGSQYTICQLPPAPVSRKTFSLSEWQLGFSFRSMINGLIHVDPWTLSHVVGGRQNTRL